MSLRPYRPTDRDERAADVIHRLHLAGCRLRPRPNGRIAWEADDAGSAAELLAELRDVKREAWRILDVTDDIAFLDRQRATSPAADTAGFGRQYTKRPPSGQKVSR
ncbi:MAG: hypothetical protein ACFCVE_06595 [Phycisphaerae bacterium]